LKPRGSGSKRLVNGGVSPSLRSGGMRMIIRRLLGAARLTTMRMQQPIPSASKLASGLAADPQH